MGLVQHCWVAKNGLRALFNHLGHRLAGRIQNFAQLLPLNFVVFQVFKLQTEILVLRTLIRREINILGDGIDSSKVQNCSVAHPEGVLVRVQKRWAAIQHCGDR